MIIGLRLNDRRCANDDVAATDQTRSRLMLSLHMGGARGR